MVEKVICNCVATLQENVRNSIAKYLMSNIVLLMILLVKYDLIY